MSICLSSKAFARPSTDLQTFSYQRFTHKKGEELVHGHLCVCSFLPVTFSDMSAITSTSLIPGSGRAYFCVDGSQDRLDSCLRSSSLKGKSTFHPGATKISFPQPVGRCAGGFSGFSTVFTGNFPQTCSKAVENSDCSSNVHKPCGKSNSFPPISSHFPQGTCEHWRKTCWFSTFSTATKKKKKIFL